MLETISKAIGTPSESNWPGVSKLKGYVATEKDKIVQVKTRLEWEASFRSIGPVGVDLLMGMFSLDPAKRLTMDQVLKHDWWITMPRPSKMEDLPKKGGGLKEMGEDLKRRGGELPNGGRADKVARKLDFGSL